MLHTPGEAVAELRTLADLVRWGASRFGEAGLCLGHGTDNAVDEALSLVLHALHLPHGIPTEMMSAALTEAERREVVELLTQRIDRRVPAAYLTHEAWFAGLRFYVDDRVLVPRSPIAELIEQGFAPWLDADRVMQVLDLCTGSGCIAIGCAHAFPSAEVDAVDVSREALEVAAINQREHHLADRLQLFESDLFDSVPHRRYDLIVSNPPYVASASMEDLSDEFRHEPALGLEAGPEGLDVVLRILAQAGDYLDDDGILVVEVGESQAALMERLPDVPFIWLDFERGGEGVFLINAAELRTYQPEILQARTDKADPAV